MTRLECAIEQIRLAREYTLRLLAMIDSADWYRIPPGGVSNVAWQVGHLAMAEYRLCLDRIRGVRPGDDEIIPRAYLTQFGRGSVPDPDPARNPPAEELRRVLERVHEQSLRELAGVSDDDLDAPPGSPHPLFNTKFGALTWTARHEMLHAGQLGLIRRQLGAAPLP